MILDKLFKNLIYKLFQKVKMEKKEFENIDLARLKAIAESYNTVRWYYDEEEKKGTIIYDKQDEVIF